ncbi:MAG TPA: ATP-binding protein [Anaerolineae bacterium]
MKTLYVLIGAPGSGKSTWTRENAGRLGAVTIGSDDVRNDFRASGRNPTDGDAVFAEVERRARDRLLAGQNVILDATHFLRRYRAYAVNLARQLGARRVAIWFDVPLDECLRRNADRPGSAFGSESVPAQVVRKIFERLQPPGSDEFDVIQRITSEEVSA